MIAQLTNCHTRSIKMIAKLSHEEHKNDSPTVTAGEEHKNDSPTYQLSQRKLKNYNY